MGTVVVTGGNRGIGYAVCEALTRKGFHVVAVTRSAEAPLPPGVERVRGDLSSRGTVAALAHDLSERYRHIHVLVHNAGVWPTRLVHNEDGIEQSFAVNHLAPFQLTQRQRRGGRTSTDSARTATPNAPTCSWSPGSRNAGGSRAGRWTPSTPA